MSSPRSTARSRPVCPLKGTRWDRPDDTVGLAASSAGSRPTPANYLAAGGLGILIGDGRLPEYSSEKVLELYYSVAVVEGISFSADYQRVENPGYDA